MGRKGKEADEKGGKKRLREKRRERREGGIKENRRGGTERLREVKSKTSWPHNPHLQCQGAKVVSPSLPLPRHRKLRLCPCLSVSISTSPCLSPRLCLVRPPSVPRSRRLSLRRPPHTAAISGILGVAESPTARRSSSSGPQLGPRAARGRLLRGIPGRGSPSVGPQGTS